MKIKIFDNLDVTAKKIVLMEVMRYKVSVLRDIAVVEHSNVKTAIARLLLLFAMALMIVEMVQMRKTVPYRVLS